MTELYFVTSADHARLTPDDRLVADILSVRGMQVRPLVWTDAISRIAMGSVLVLRSVWDYHLHAPAFLAWLAAVEAAGHRVLNAPPLVRWNLDKHYLRDLATAGVEIVPTRWVSRDTVNGLEDAAHAFDTDELVVKPTVSASAFETHRLDLRTGRGEATRLLDDLHQRFDLLVQPYLPEIESQGEWSLIFLGGEYSHSVRKRPALGDFRVQLDLGGTVRPEVAPAHVQHAAARALACLPGGAPLYARIDGVTVDGQFLLMEAECIDPVLYFRSSAEGAVKFADCLAEVIRGSAPSTEANLYRHSERPPPARVP